MKSFKVSSVSEYVTHIQNIAHKGDFWFRGVPRFSQYPLPGLIWKKLVNDEGTLVHNFLVNYKSYVEIPTLNSWELYALMQHHGLPTRLLDWSESALVALYFTLTSEPSYNGLRCVWVLNPFSLNKNSIGKERLYCPAVMADKSVTVGDRNINFDSYLPPNLKPDRCGVMPEFPLAIQTTQHIKRVASQKGCFTIHGKSVDYLGAKLSDPFDFHAIKIDTKGKHSRLDWLKFLEVMGIDEEFIYQDLDSLCKKIKRAWCSVE